MIDHQFRRDGETINRRSDRREGKPVPVPSNPKTSYERYIALARSAALTGDTVTTENFYQHAEHYFRLMREKDTGR